MTIARIIPRLDIKGDNVVKGIHLEGLRIVGQPRNMAFKYYHDGADEIIFMDVVASLYGRNNIFSVVKDSAKDIFIPLTVGGGIRNTDDILIALLNGADKVAINTAAVNNPEFIKEAANIFGSQCLVISIEAKRQNNGDYLVMTDNGRELTKLNVVDWAYDAQELGAGEIMITSVDQEGTRLGFDYELMNNLSKCVDIPIIACGGAGKSDDISKVLDIVGVDAASCSSIFHYNISSISNLKKELIQMGCKIRK
jgi:imidazole glycerol-phosphate synthase subunit HisF